MKRSPLKRRTPLRPRATRPCAHCGKPMENPYYSRKFCDKTCRNSASLKRMAELRGPVPCRICGEPFIPRGYSPSVLRGATCSKKCAGRAISRAKLGRRNPNWKGQKDLRAAWDASRKDCCEICLGTQQLRIHHIIYAQHVRKRGGDEWDPRNGMTLCMSCHSRHHNGTDFRILVCDFPHDFWAFGHELLAESLWDYLARHYDDGNIALSDLLSSGEDVAA